MKILELKQTISNRNKALYGLTAESRGQRRIRELENRSTEIIKSEQRREKI